MRRVLDMIIFWSAFCIMPAQPALAQNIMRLGDDCSLADAITAANENRAVGGCPSGTANDIIVFSEDITLAGELPPINGTITIEGNGHTISGDYRYRIFDVVGRHLTINNLTLTLGRANDEEDMWGTYGGAIRLRGGQVTVNNSRFINNGAKNGGAIAVRLGSPKLQVRNSTFVSNTAYKFGGAIVNGSPQVRSYGSVSIHGSSFVSNTAIFQLHSGGGAVADLSNGSLEISDSSFSHNVALKGGAIGVNVNDYSFNRAYVALNHLTFVKNGAYEMEGTALWSHPDNPRVSLRNSVISDIIRQSSSCIGDFKANQGNLIEDGSCNPDHIDDALLGRQVNAPSRNQALSGSPHFLPQAGSPLIDAADQRYCSESDQLGNPRPQGAACDIGAIESGGSPAAQPALSCDLRQQILAANADARADGCPAGDGADTITLTGDIVLQRSLPPITSNITIEGAGHSISGAERFRIFVIDGASLTLRGLTMTQGKAVGDGGAILLKEGARLTASGVTISHSQARNGGAIAMVGDESALVLERGSLVSNTAQENGGAIFLNGGEATISRSAIGKSSANGNTPFDGHGGAIAIKQGQLQLRNSTVYDNRAARGGGVYIEAGDAALAHVTLRDNQSTASDGIGLQQVGGEVSLRNSIVSGRGRGRDCVGEFVELSGNISSDGSCSPGWRGDARLGDAAGSPPAYPLLDGSPALDAADQRYCLPVDQHGAARAPDAACDIGALESQLAATAQPVAQHALSTADCPLADLIIAANTDAAYGDCPAGYLSDTIELHADIVLDAPLPLITSDIAIRGQGHTVDGAGLYRIFDLDGGQLSLFDMTLARGNAQGGLGGAIRLRNGAVLQASYTLFTGNRAGNGAAVGAHDSTVNMRNIGLLGNSADKRGPGLFIAGSSRLNVGNVTHWNNSAAGEVITGKDRGYSDLFVKEEGGVRGTSSYIEEDSALAELTAGLLIQEPGEGILSRLGCSLGDAILAVNQQRQQGNCQLAGVDEAYTMTGDISLREPLPPISGDIAIDGAGYSISGEGRTRVFYVDGGKLTLRNIMLAHGGGVDAGGAVLVQNGGDLIASNATFTNNSAVRGSAIQLDGGTLVIQDSVFIGNRADVSSQRFEQFGGTVAMSSGRAEMRGSSFYGNRAMRGGAADGKGEVQIVDSSLGGNRAPASDSSP